MTFALLFYAKKYIMKISFHGAARTVTGSKHLITLKSGKNILLDCGMFQGQHKESELLNKDFGFFPREIDYVLLSHAHIDHSGLLPKLVKEGFMGKIYCTEATADIVELLLLDSAHIQEEDAKYYNKKHSKKSKSKPVEPLYTTKDVESTLHQLVIKPYDEPFSIDDEITVTFRDAGHILGSATIFLEIKEAKKVRKILFTGDVGRYQNPVLKSPEEIPQADIVICESTYGNSLHESQDGAKMQLLEAIQHTCIKKKGKLIIPASSLGRTQEILFSLNNLFNGDLLPPLKVFVDSPLSTRVTELVRTHTECFNNNIQKLMKTDSDPFTFSGLRFITDVADSKKLNARKRPCIIISAAGMADAGRVKHHIANNIESKKNTILFVGYCEPSTLGGKLMSGAKEVTIFGDNYKVAAEVKTMHAYSAHADYDELCQFLAPLNPNLVEKFFVVHGEPTVQDEFIIRLNHKGFANVVAPKLHEHFFI
jgi:metallo-beta-lactamase family protein